MQNKARFRGVFLCALITIIGAGAAVAQVNQGELERNLSPVTFMNYEGPHARIDTREQIRQIGAGLGQAISGGAERAGGTGRYFVIHSVTPPEGDKLDADIFGLGVDVGVDHIRNLRWIIQGYLQEAYGYSERDAALLAEYVTVYNAVYRGDWDYFSARYKTPVMGNLTTEKAGLSIRYDEWPGRTLMLIPLGLGGLSSIDTSAITDNRVVEELRKGDEQGIEQRKDMVELKEREAEAAEQRAEVVREAVKEEEKQIAQEREQVRQEREQIAREREQAAPERPSQPQQQPQQTQQSQQQPQAQQQTQQQQQNRTEAGSAPAETRQREEELAKREQAADEKDKELDNREAALEPQREEARRAEEFAERKTGEAQQERQSIAQDQQAAINQRAPAGVIGVTFESAASTLGRLVRLNAVNGEELRRSPLNTISVRSLTLINGKVIAIAGESSGGGAIRLIEINSGDLTMAKQGEDDVHPTSLIWVNGNDLYVITANKANGTLNLGRFDANLTLLAKSETNVHTNASVTIQQGNLLTQRRDGQAVILDPIDLKEVAGQ